MLPLILAVELEREKWLILIYEQRLGNDLTDWIWIRTEQGV